MTMMNSVAKLMLSIDIIQLALIAQQFKQNALYTQELIRLTKHKAGPFLCLSVPLCNIDARLYPG
jgi:hypothetical protein